MGKTRSGPGQAAMEPVRDAGGNALKSSEPSTELTADGQLIGEPCVLDGILIATDGTNDVTVQLYDNTAGSGKKLAPPITIPGADRLGGFISLGIRASIGVYADITLAAGTTSVVGYYNS